MNSNLTFLGICNHVIPDYTIAKHVPQLTFINLAPFSYHICFPAPLMFGYLVFASTSLGGDDDQLNISFRKEDRTIKLLTYIAGKLDHEPDAGEFLSQQQEGFISGINGGSFMIAVPLSKIKAVIPSVGLYDVVLNDNVTIGKIYFGKVQKPELTHENKESIRRDPKLLKAISMTIECNVCKDVLRYHTSLEGDFLPENSCTVQELPDYYKCSCGSQCFDMADTKIDFDKYIGSEMHVPSSGYYANSALVCALTSQRKEFLELLNQELREEEYQKFLSNNQFFLAIFAPVSVHDKLSLLGKYDTDFVIIDSRKDMILVEIEKPTTKLVLNNNANHSELTHAIGQLSNWLHIVTEHKTALLDMWRMNHIPINSIRGVVIAGRDYKYSEEQLRIMKASNSSDRIKVYTYDDILRAVDVLIESIKRP